MLADNRLVLVHMALMRGRLRWMGWEKWWLLNLVMVMMLLRILARLIAIVGLIMRSIVVALACDSDRINFTLTTRHAWDRWLMIM